MEAIQALMTRRSIRKYQSKPIADDTIETLLRAAMAAPSAVNSQDWEFIVVRDRSTMDAVAEKLGGSGNMLHEAAAAVIVCGNLDHAFEKLPDYWVEDCAAATENLLLAAHALGLGAVWLGTYPQPVKTAGITQLFSLPKQIIPFSVISLGYPAEEKEAVDRYCAEKVHFEKW